MRNARRRHDDHELESLLPAAFQREQLESQRKKDRSPGLCSTRCVLFALFVCGVCFAMTSQYELASSELVTQLQQSVVARTQGLLAAYWSVGDAGPPDAATPATTAPSVALSAPPVPTPVPPPRPQPQPLSAPPARPPGQPPRQQQEQRPRQLPGVGAQQELQGGDDGDGFAHAELERDLRQKDELIEMLNTKLDAQQRALAALEHDHQVAQAQALALAQAQPQTTNAGESALPAHDGLLPPLQSLLLDELPLRDPVDLQSEEIASLPPYSLYRVPGERWVAEAAAELERNQDALRKAQHHVHDPLQRVTVVTALFDLGRGNLENVDNFKRKFDEYLQRMQRTVNVDMPMVVFIEARHVSSLDFSHHTRGVVVIPWSIEHLKDAFPTYYDRIEQIRASPLYKKQAKHTGWLQYSPQAALNGYNLLVMSKPFLLRWAAELNPWRTQYLMFVDGGHDCIGALKPDHLDLLRHLMGRLMVTFFNYGASLSGETHGMTQKAYRHYLGAPHNDSNTWDHDQCCRVVRGGIFGGTPAYINAFARMYNHALSQSLADGYMGTEENILGMLLERFPKLFNAYENVRDNCDVLVDAGERARADMAVYAQGDEPDEWDPQHHRFAAQHGDKEPLVVDDRRVGG